MKIFQLLFISSLFFDLFININCYNLNINIITLKINKNNQNNHKNNDNNYNNNNNNNKKSIFIILIGILEINNLNKEIYYLEGKGKLNIINKIQEENKEERNEDYYCKYATVTSVEANHQKTIPNYLNIAIHCEVNYINESDESNENNENNEKLSRLFFGKIFLITIYPFDITKQYNPDHIHEYLSKNVLAYDRIQNIHYQLSKEDQIIPPSLTSSIEWNPIYNPNYKKKNSKMISIQYFNMTSLKIYPNERDQYVCLVQTFHNSMTHSMLYLCIEYYLSIGWGIILFDRNGNHKDIINERYQSNNYIIYYPFTVFELLFPERLKKVSSENKQIISNIQSFKYYSKHGAHGFSNNFQDILQNNEEADDDADRRLTYQLARQLYSDISFLLYVDRDEFLYCPIHETKNTNKLQQHFQMKFFSSFQDRNISGVKMRRFAYTPRFSLKDSKNDSILYTLSDIRSLDINNSVQNCMEEGYKSKNTTLMWSCWSIANIPNAKPKCLEISTNGDCPLIGVHEICLRCNCRIQLLNRCHFIHLNGIYLKPKSILKYKTDIYKPLSLY